MLKDIRALGKESFIYGLSTVAARLLNFLLLPFYTHYLAPGQYGVVATLYSYIAFLNVVYQYGMDQAYMRYAAKRGDGGLESKFSTPFWALLLSSAAFSAVLHLGAEPAARLAGYGPQEASLVRYAAWILALDALAAVPFAELRLDHRPWAYAGIKSFNIALNVGMNVVFLAVLGLGVNGVFLASLVSSAATLVLLAPLLALRLRIVFDRALFPELLRFGLPLVPAGLGAMMIQVIDRPILKALTDDATVGVYQANYRLGILMMLVVSMFDQAWRPFFLQRADEPGARELFGRVLTYFLLGGEWLVLAISFFIGDVVRLPLGHGHLIAPAYWSGLGVVPVVLLGYLFFGAYINFMASVTLAKRTDMLVWVTGLGAAVNVGANFLLIPRWGMMGAAWATLAAYAATAATLYLAGRRVYPIPYEYGRLAHLAGVGIVVAAAGWRFHDGTARAALLILFPVLLWATRFFKEDELRLFRGHTT